MSFAFGLGGQYTLESDAAFNAELEDILANVESTVNGLERIDLSIQAYLNFAAQFYDQYLLHESDIERCISRILDSAVLTDHPDRCINDVIELLVTSPEPATQHLSLFLLLRRGRTHPHIYRWLRKSRLQDIDAPSVLTVCMSLIERYGEQSVGTVADGDDKPHPAQDRLGVTATQVLYEVCRVSRFEQNDLALFTETFISHLFRLVESTRDGDEVFNYSLVKLIISLNEQFMVASVGDEGPVTASSTAHKRKSSKHLTQPNRVLSLLSQQLGALKTFGENLIFILNRLGPTPEDLCVALLILKMLYLLFSTPATHEYFYTNDLCVLVDVFVRELSDLPEESEGLRHTYLRVLHPLLTNTQLREHPYKRHQIRRVLRSLIAENNIREVNSTTKRLAERNLKAEWCTELERNGVTLEEAVKQASPTQIEAAQTSVSGNLNHVIRKSSTGSMASSSSMQQTASASVLGGHLHTEPMAASITSIGDVARTTMLGKIRKHISSSSSDRAAAAMLPSRPDSPEIYLTESAPASPSRLHAVRTESGQLSPDGVLSPPSRPSSAMSGGSPSGRRPPPLPPQTSSRRPPSAASTHPPPTKQRRPPPPRPQPNSGLGIESLAVQ